MTPYVIAIGIILVMFLIKGRSKTSEKQGSQEQNNFYKPSTRDHSLSYSTKNNKTTANVPTVAELVKSINTIEEYDQFEKKYDEISQLYSQDFENKYNEKMYKRYEAAFSSIGNKLSDKIFYYQYVPPMDLDTPLKCFTDAYKIFTPEEYKIKKKGTNKLDWQEIVGSQLMGGVKKEDSNEKKPAFFDTLLKFREIVESKEISEEKERKIRALINSDSAFQRSFYHANNVWEKDIVKYSKWQKTSKGKAG